MSFKQKMNNIGQSLKRFFTWAVSTTFVAFVVGLLAVSVGGEQLPILKQFDLFLLASILMVLVCVVASLVAYVRVEDDLASLLWWLYGGSFIAINVFRFFGQLVAIVVSVLFLVLTVFLIFKIRQVNAPPVVKEEEDQNEAEIRAAKIQRTGKLAIEDAKGKLIDLGAVTELDVQARATAALAEAKRVQIEEREQALKDYQFALDHENQYTKEELAILKRRAHQFDASKSAETTKLVKKAGFRSGNQPKIIEW